MSGSTPGGIVYPSSTDVPDGAAQMQALAESVEAGLAWQTSGIVAATGWTLVSQEYRKVGSVVYFRVNLTRSGGNISVTTATGAISASAVATMPAGYVPSVLQGGLASVNQGRGAHGYIDTSGNVTLAAVTGAGSAATQVATGDTITLGGSYLLG